MPEVWLPPRIQALTGGRQQVAVPGATVRQVINNLEREYPGARDLLMDVEEDDLLPGLAVVVDGETSLLGLLERVGEGSEVHFLPAIGGGVGGGRSVHRQETGPKQGLTWGQSRYIMRFAEGGQPYCSPLRPSSHPPAFSFAYVFAVSG